jgi:hypothetical protein
MELLHSTDDHTSEHSATLHALLGIVSVCARASRHLAQTGDATQLARDSALTLDLMLGVVRLISSVQQHLAEIPELEAPTLVSEPSLARPPLREIGR